MRIAINSIVVIVLLLATKQTEATIPERAGWWKFDNPSNLTLAEAGYGTALTLVGTHTAANGPEAGSGSVLIGIGSYYKMQHLISPNGGGVKVNEYSLQYDFKIPENNVWHSFFQTASTNNDDGDFFINPSGNIGVSAVGYSNYSIIPNQWYRLLISVKNGSWYKCYLDGNLILTGNIQTIDGRFSLENLLLIFADDDGEDANIYCSELSIWNNALSEDQAKELGGYSHYTTPFLMTRIPYLQADGTNTMTICWHDTAQLGTKVEYGLNSTLGYVIQGSSEIVSEPYRWHTVKLTGLQANTRYFYKVESGDGVSEIYSFKTLPDATYTGKIRFVIYGDTHASDTTMAGKVLRATRAKISELYGSDIENHVTGIFHTGDIVVSGNIPENYSTQFFHPLAALSPNLPTMVVAGNHEGESPYFYSYLKLDDQSAFPLNPALNEKIWQQKIGNSLFIGLNANIINQYGTAEANWLDSRLNEAESDTDIDFIFLFIHHPPFSELWYYAINTDASSNYVRDILIPIIKKYSKVQQLHYGHTHGFERGTVQSSRADGDFRIICGGGGGGPLDPWDDAANHDINNIHICFSNYFFQILEIDIANHSYQNSMYSLGDLNKTRNSECLDSWYKKTNQPIPLTPIAENVVLTDEYTQFFTSEFSGIDSIMSVQLQVVEGSDNPQVIVDSTLHWKDIFGVDSYYNPIDKNRDINLYQIKISSSHLPKGKTYYFHVRYRDHNLKWSEWSNKFSFITTGIADDNLSLVNYHLNQNYPNPFQYSTIIKYNIPKKSEVKFRIYDEQCRIVADINEGVKNKGNHQIDFNSGNLSSGIYYYQMITNNLSLTKKMIKI
jgi:hypothetical protein